MLERQELEAFDGIRSWVQSTLGITFSDDKLDSLERRLDEVLLQTNLPDYRALYAQLTSRESSPVHFAVSQAMTTNHTAFFREPDTLDAFFEVSSKALQDEPLRVWSAACSTGQEPYSLAMMATERFGAEAARRVAILATDISHGAIQAATDGRYLPHAMHGVSEARRERFFHRTDTGFEVASELRAMCTFRRLNLAVASWPFKRRFHAVYCRNVLYYFDPDLRRRIAIRLHAHTMPGGRLFTSVTEALRGLETPWKYVAPGMYEKDGER